MRSSSALALVRAKERPAVVGSDSETTAACGSDEENHWFKRACDTLLGKDAGFALHTITGFPERTCYYYASGDRKPPEFFLRTLFSKPEGEPFWKAFNEECAPPCWPEYQRALRVAEAIAAAR